MARRSHLPVCSLRLLSLLSSTWGRADQQASHDSNRVWGVLFCALISTPPGRSPRLVAGVLAGAVACTAPAQASRRVDSGSYTAFFCFALHAAQRAFCAAAIFLRDTADILRRGAAA